MQKEGKRKFSVYHELDENYYSSSTWSFLRNIYDILGFKNIADEADTAKTGYPKLSEEYIMVSNPDIIVTSGLKNNKQLKFALRAGWNASNAVQNEAIISLEPYIVVRWGPRLIDFCEQIIHKSRVIGYD